MWENLQNEKEKAVANGISDVQRDEILLVDGY